MQSQIQLDTGNVVRQAAVDQQQNALSTEQILKAQLDNMNEREQSRLRSTVIGAAQLKTYLDRNDLDGAHDFLVNRQNALHARMGAGENIDDQETAYALQKLRSGDVDGLKNDVGAMLAAGQAYGMIGGSGMPASIQEWQYYNALTPEDQKRWLEQKRANQVANLGGNTMVLGPDGKPIANYNHTLKPEDQPENAKNKANATAQGNVEGTNAANAAFSAEGLKGVNAALKDLQTSGKAAPGGVAQNLGAQIANQSGLGGGAADAQGDFTVKRAAAENAIREAFRVAGSGAQSDADAKPFIDMLPVATDSDSVKVAKTNAAMQAVTNRINVKLQQAQGTPAPTQGGGGKITVSNGQESFQIDAADLAAAQAEGFQQVQ